MSLRQAATNIIGSSVIFTVSIIIALVMEKLLDIDLTVAILIQILWLVCQVRWHQPSRSELP